MTVINYKDDLLVVAIGPTAATGFDEAARTVVEVKLGMARSEKKEARRTVGSAADFVGAHFYASSPAQPVFCPVNRFQVILQEAVQSLRVAKHGLLPIEAALSAAGRLQFASIFVLGWRFFLNSIYRFVAASARLRTRMLQVPLSPHCVAHAETLLYAPGTHAHPVCDLQFLAHRSLFGWRLMPAPTRQGLG